MEQIEKQIQGQREAALRNKFTSKNYSETWRGLRLAVSPLAFLIQIITASLAVGLPAYAIKVLSGSWVWGFVCGGVLLFAFEYVKRMIVQNTAISYFRNIADKKPRKLSRVGLVSVIAVLGLSIASSVISTPLLVEEFAPLPEKVKEEQITARFDSLRDAASLYWGERGRYKSIKT